MLASGVIGASMAFFEGIALKGLVWLEHGSYENYMLSQYKKYQNERRLQEVLHKEESQTVTDKWREYETEQNNNEPRNTLGSVARAIVIFLNEKFNTSR